MDINKIQKLNQLASDLKRHNVVDSKEEAIMQAERVVGASNPRMQSNMQPEDQVHELEKEVRRLGFAVKETQEKIIEIMNTLNKLTNQIETSRPNPQAARMERQQELASKKDTNKPIDRNQVAPSDISIEKYFYFGKK